MNKVVYVPAHFASLYDKRRVGVPTGIYKNLFLVKKRLSVLVPKCEK